MIFDKPKPCCIRLTNNGSDVQQDHLVVNRMPPIIGNINLSLFLSFWKRLTAGTGNLRWGLLIQTSQLPDKVRKRRAAESLLAYSALICAIEYPLISSQYDIDGIVGWSCVVERIIKLDYSNITNPNRDLSQRDYKNESFSSYLYDPLRFFGPWSFQPAIFDYTRL